jgi:hypothetical protein
MASFVAKYTDQIFVDKTDLICEIMSKVVPIRKHQLPVARQEAIGFVMWLLELEQQRPPQMTRCRLAIGLAVFSAAGGSWVFCDYLPPELRRISKVYNKLAHALSGSGAYENQIRELLQIYDDYLNFPSVRAGFTAASFRSTCRRRNISAPL